MKHIAKITLYNSYYDKNDRLSPKSILNIMQDVASIHGEEIGVGYLPMLEKNLYWVLSRVKFDIIKMPVPNQEVIVETWPHEKGKIDFDRDIKILDLKGELLVKATTKWCVIDTVKRMLQRTENVVYNGEVIQEKLYDQKFLKVTLPETEKLYKYTYKVKFSDLDHNQHMNNTNYANLVVNALEEKQLTHLELNFVNESQENDEIDVYLQKNENGEFVVGYKEDKTIFVGYAY